MPPCLQGMELRYIAIGLAFFRNSTHLAERGISCAIFHGTHWSAPVEELQQPAPLEVEEIDLVGFLDHLEGELQQADFPRIIHPQDHRRQRVV